MDLIRKWLSSKAPIDIPSLAYHLIGVTCSECNEIVSSFNEHTRHIRQHVSDQLRAYQRSAGMPETNLKHDEEMAAWIKACRPPW